MDVRERSKAMSKSGKVGRSAVTGRYTTVKIAVSRPSTHVVETIKKGK